MSGYNVKWIWDQQISAVQKLVLFALNEHCNPAHNAQAAMFPERFEFREPA